METARPETAFILAGGGSLGAVQVGMLRALLESGIEPDMVVGSSVGAINGAYFAGDPTLQGISRLVAPRAGSNAPTSFRGLGAGSLALFAGTVISYHPTGSDVFSTTICRIAIWRTRSSRCTSSQPTSSAKPWCCRAVRRRKRSWPAPQSLPLLHRWKSTAGFFATEPLRAIRPAAIALGARRLIVLPTGFACAPERVPSGALATALHAITLLTARQLYGAGTDQAANSVSHSTYRLSARCFTI